MTYILVIADLLDKGNSLKRWRRPSKERIAEQQAKRFHHLAALNEAAGAIFKSHDRELVYPHIENLYSASPGTNSLNEQWLHSE
jgi:hypothetical protein